MESSSFASESIGRAPHFGYDYVGRQIAALIERFGLHESRSQILQTYEDICRDSFISQPGAASFGRSRINHDGAPIQYAATLGPSARTLQFLGEAGGPDLSNGERMRVNRECLAVIAQRLHAAKALSSVAPLLDDLAPAANADLLADPSGAYWLGVAFNAERGPHLRVYVNARWGREQDQWVRSGLLAAYFGKSAIWDELAAGLRPDLHPLGVAITLQGDRPLSGRVYLSAYGKPMTFYETLAESYGGAEFRRRLRDFGLCLLADDYVYPTQTAICSFGFGDDPTPDFKFELCAHCLFPSDEEAAARLRAWFEKTQLDAADYWALLDLLSEGALSKKALDLHCYVGVGLRRGALYSTIYLKPQLVAG